MKTKKTIKSIAHALGIEIGKYRQIIHPLSFLTHLNIQTILDIGANEGQFAAEVRSWLPEAALYSFEPLTECYKKLVASRKSDHHFQAFQLALGQTAATIPMHKSSYTPSSSLKTMTTEHKEAFPHSARETIEKVEVERLDDVAKKINLRDNLLIKMDVQGFEDQVILGGPETVRRAKVIFIEASFVELYSGQALFDDLYSTLKRLGFSYEGSINTKRHPKTGRILFEDAVFLNL